MKKKISIIGLSLMMLSGVFVGQAQAADDEPATGYMVWGEWHRSLIDFYINKLNRLVTVSPEQEVKVRALLNKESDLMSEAQHKYRGNAVRMVAEAVKICHGSHEELKTILTEDQQYVIPGIIEARKADLEERWLLVVENLWYKIENDID